MTQYIWLLWTLVAMDASEDDSEEVNRLVLERTLDMLEEDHIPIHVIPTRGPKLHLRSPGLELDAEGIPTENTSDGPAYRLPCG